MFNRAEKLDKKCTAKIITRSGGQKILPLMSPSDDLFSQKWSSQGFRPRERFDAWQAALNASHLGWTLQKNQKRGFSAQIRRLEKCRRDFFVYSDQV